MNVVVLVKQVPDMNAVRIDRASGKLLLGGQQVVSSYDAHAVEEALRLKERLGGEVTVVTVGPAAAKDALSRALAMGADRALLVETPDANALDTLALARLLADHLRAIEFDLILAGQTADDYESGQVGAQVAEVLDLPLVSSAVELQTEDGRIVVRRDTEDGYQTVSVPLPAVVLASTGLNEPRYPSLKGIMAAKKKPLDRVAAEPEEAVARLSWDEPVVPERGAAGVVVQDVPPAEAARQLVAWLREQKLI